MKTPVPLRSLFPFFAALVVCLLISGCAEVIIEKDGRGRGYDVYRPEPYLLVFAQTNLTTEQPIKLDELAPGGGGGGGSNPPTQMPETGATSGVEGLNGPGVTVIWLPNYSERYRVHSSAFFLSKAGAQFTIRDGWMLTGVTDQSDNTALLTAAQTVLSSALGSASSTAKTTSKAALVAGAKSQTKTEITQGWKLYKFLFDEKGNFYGLVEVIPEPDKLKDFRPDGAKANFSPNPAPTYDEKRK